MSTLAEVLVFTAILSSAVIGGVFFAFSSFIMGSLGRLPSEQGIAAMQSINIVVINKSFLGTFFGTAILCIVLIVMAFTGDAGIPWQVTVGAFAYLVGTILVTVAGNVPLNNELANQEPRSEQAKQVWDKYLVVWTRLNTVRTVAALVAAGLMTGSLISGSLFS